MSFLFLFNHCFMSLLLGRLVSVASKSLAKGLLLSNLSTIGGFKIAAPGFSVSSRTRFKTAQPAVPPALYPDLSYARHRDENAEDKVSKIEADKVPIVLLRTGRFFVTVNVNGDTQNTAIAIAESGRASWDDEFHLDIPRTSALKITLFAVHRLRTETIVGWEEERIDAGLWSSGFELLPSDAPSASDRQRAAANSGKNREVRDVASALHAVWFGPEVKTTGAAAKVNLGTVDDFPKSFSALLKLVDLFTNLISRFSEIHPYAKFACSVLTMVQRVVNDQKERDNRFRQLIKVISEVFSFLNELQVAALEGHRQTIKLLTLQTTECAYFIRDYTKKSFMTTGELDDLPYASGARFDLGKQCLPGTREDVLEKIFAAERSSREWQVDDRAYSFAAVQRAAAAGVVLLLPSRASGAQPDKLFSTIARDLADLDPEWKEALSRSGPARAAQNGVYPGAVRGVHPQACYPPVRVFWTGADRHRRPGCRRGSKCAPELISLLSSRAAELPSNFRILITARPDPDICRAFEKRVGIAWWPMHVVIDEKSNLRDIDEFFTTNCPACLGRSGVTRPARG
ncbi:hypothetical protein B0H13DRAFT_1899786 [Mycena leptocephala]|nr:hypothetical protein B0H13DRAFT_1899786 [Mycena leptocephala]